MKIKEKCFGMNHVPYIHTNLVFSDRKLISKKKNTET